MSSETHPTITSFIIRFIHEKDADSMDTANWRGSVRHIQTDQELIFTQWGDALSFMQRFLPPIALDPPPSNQ